MNKNIASSLRNLLDGARDDESLDSRASLLADDIIAYADTIDARDADAIMRDLRLLDPYDSNIGAYIRDTLRDNTDLTL